LQRGSVGALDEGVMLFLAGDKYARDELHWFVASDFQMTSLE